MTRLRLTPFPYQTGLSGRDEGPPAQMPRPGDYLALGLALLAPALALRAGLPWPVAVVLLPFLTGSLRRLSGPLLIEARALQAHAATQSRRG